MLKLLGRRKFELNCLAVDVLLAGAVLVPLLMFLLLSAAANTGTQIGPTVAVTLWAAAAVGVLALRRYLPGQTRDKHHKSGKNLLIRVFQSIAIILVVVLSGGLFAATSGLEPAARFIVFPVGFAILILVSTVVFSLPALARPAVLAEDFSLKRAFRYANWSLKKSPLETLSAFLQELMFSLITWLPVGAILIFISYLPNRFDGLDIPILAILTTAVIAGAHCALVIYQNRAGH